MGTVLADITAINYWAYRDSSSTNSLAQTISLNIEVDYVGDGTSFTTLVYEPVYNLSQPMLLTTWQQWDALAGGNARWWSTKPIPGVCDFNCFVEWSTIVSNNPNAKIKYGLGFNVGSGWTGVYNGAADGLSIGISGDTTTYDFEPPDLLAPITSNVVASPNPSAVSSSVTVSANVDDTNTGGSPIVSAEYSLDSGTSWSPMAAVDNTFDEVNEDVTATFTSSEEPGVFNLCVRGTDAAGNTSAMECIFFVVYDPNGGFVTGGGWIDSPAGAYMVNDLVWDQGFEVDTAGWIDASSSWYGTITRVPSGSNGIISSTGGYHAVVEGDNDSAPFTRFDGFRSTWPGKWIAEIDIYLDPNWAAGQGFDYSVAATGSDGAHQRDYIFHVTKDTSTGKLFVAGSNNTNFAPREDLENINHYEVSTAGWYTFQHVFYESSGALAVDLNLLDSNRTALFTETRFNAADTIPAEVGGNRYGWFTFVNVSGGIAVDEHQLEIANNVAGKASFGFVSKYVKGKSEPTGNTEFVFQAAGLTFRSDAYEWLLVNKAGYNAQYKGSGIVNGGFDPNGSPYKFMLWATDGDPLGNMDTFRLKVWWEESVNESVVEHVVYDNGFSGSGFETGQPIINGSIIVHIPKK